MSKRFMGKYDHKKYGWLRFGKQAAVAIAVAIVFFYFVIGASFVDGNSMEPTMSDGDVAVFLRLGSAYDRGDIVSVRMPNGTYYVKRVIAIEGDIVDLRDGAVYVNGQEIEEPYLANSVDTRPQNGNVTYPYEVKADNVFVMGDNRPNSMDSRAFGSVVTDQIKGKIIATF